jgi:hypothetical protein
MRKKAAPACRAGSLRKIKISYGPDKTCSAPNYLQMDEIWLMSSGTNLMRAANVSCTASNFNYAANPCSLMYDGSNITTYFSKQLQATSAVLVFTLPSDVAISSITLLALRSANGNPTFAQEQKCFMVEWLDSNNKWLQVGRHRQPASVPHAKPAAGMPWSSNASWRPGGQICGPREVVHTTLATGVDYASPLLATAEECP